MIKFPRKQEITEIKHIKVYYKGKFKFFIENSIQLNNLRLWALKNEETHNIIFLWENISIEIRPNGDLSKWPYGFLDTESRQLAEIIKFRQNKKNV